MSNETAAQQSYLNWDPAARLLLVRDSIARRRNFVVNESLGLNSARPFTVLVRLDYVIKYGQDDGMRIIA